MLKHRLLALTLFCIAGLMTASAVAQDNDPSQSAPPDHPRHGQFDPGKRTEMLTKRLNLTPDQQPKVLEALKAEQSQMEALHSDSSLSQEDRHSKMMDIHKSTNDQIRGILTADQQKRWDEIQSRREQWQGHRGGQNSPPPDSPNQSQ